MRSSFIGIGVSDNAEWLVNAGLDFHGALGEENSWTMGGDTTGVGVILRTFLRLASCFL